MVDKINGNNLGVKIDKISDLGKIQRLRTYILQFIYKDGNGWAFVNATTPTQAETVFKNQTKFEGAEVVSIKETKYYGQNMQLVYEGAVTTISNLDINRIESIVNAAIKKYDFTSAILEAVENKFKELDLEDILHINLEDYIRKDEIEEYVEQAITNVSGFLDRQGVIDLISELNIHGRDGKDGQDGRNGTDGADGTDGVGITNITYNSTTGKLTIYLTNATSYQFDMPSGGGSGGGTVEVLDIGHGLFEDALDAAETNPNKMFQWILEDFDSNNVPVRKILWHVGDGEFIDALGSIISVDD